MFSAAGKKKASNPPKTEKDAHAHQQKLRDEKKQEKVKAAQKAPVGKTTAL